MKKNVQKKKGMKNYGKHRAKSRNTTKKTKIEELGYELYDVEYVKEGKTIFKNLHADNEKEQT